jgi:endonuclease YncB( thermonuclease family)
MQTNDTIILANARFSTLEKNELLNAKFTAKPKEKLTPGSPLIFNKYILIQDGNIMSLRQKEQGKKIKLIDIDTPDAKQRYVEQRAREAYIASIC